MERPLLTHDAMTKTHAAQMFGLLALTLGLGACFGQVDGASSEADATTPAPWEEPSFPDGLLSWQGACESGGKRCVLHSAILAEAGAYLGLSRGNVSTELVAQSTNEAVVKTPIVTTQCSCVSRSGEGDARRTKTYAPVDLGTACPAGAARTCMAQVRVETRSPGEATIEIKDASGGVFQDIVVQVREVASIHLEARLEAPSETGGITFDSGPPLTPAVDGAVEIPVDRIVQVTPIFRDHTGGILAFGTGDKFAYVADPSTLDDDLAFRSNEVLPTLPKRFRVRAMGSSSVTVEGRGVRGELVVRGVR